MTITKLGHCCLLIETDTKRILTDPGIFTTAEQEAVEQLDAVLITHEHADHLHVESLKRVLAKNPNARVITNAAVGKILAAAGIAFEAIEQRQSTDVNGVSIEGFGDEHAEIYRDYKLVRNTGYMIHDRFFYPGDAFTNPGKPVEILALPVAGPWMRIKEAIDYALALKPTLAFPVHDGILSSVGSAHTAPEEFLGEAGIEFMIPELGTPFETDSS
ncbi:MBL fold metallo-hydrolase [Candidatus Berkelbacteria bacterium]|nr:MBL fold metallo-hydrolase [Candidatus Berkelbacteria bacterium]